MVNVGIIIPKIESTAMIIELARRRVRLSSPSLKKMSAMKAMTHIEMNAPADSGSIMKKVRQGSYLRVSGSHQDLNQARAEE